MRAAFGAMVVKNELKRLVCDALRQLAASGTLNVPSIPLVQIDATHNRDHGEFASNVAMVLAKSAGMPPRKLADFIVAALPSSPLLLRCEIAGPGFINFFLEADAFFAVVPEVLQAADAYGRAARRDGAVLIEFVSANPTGPLHVGHGRGAAYGAALAALLKAAGYPVDCEYYINDAGRQMDILAISVWLRYLERLGQPCSFPAKGYRGDYIAAIAANLAVIQGHHLIPDQDHLARLDTALAASGDDEGLIDACVAICREALGNERYATLVTFSSAAILENIRGDLAVFGVPFDHWFSERTLFATAAIDDALAALRASGHLYEEGGAVWFRSSTFGDEKDRVVVRENGQHTYFASDIAYHLNKRQRGYARLIDIWGADHHGYIRRLKGAYQALGADPNELEVLLVQFATLLRGGAKVSMSTRSGEFVPLRQLIDEVGRDAARFFYITRRSEQHLEFDLDLAKSQSADNPVFYIQYAHARVRSVFAQLTTRSMAFDREHGERHLARLQTDQEREIAVRLGQFPELIETAAAAREPHQIANFLKDLAALFHVYYNSTKFIVDDVSLRNARLCLIEAVRIVLANGLRILGVAAPDTM
jgi:arginyl-tRNA synthetase